MAIVNEVITQFSYKGDITKISNYNKSLGKAIKIVSVFATATIASAAALAVFTNRVADSVFELRKLQDITGSSIENIQEIGFAATQTESSIGAVNSTFASLADKIGNAALKGDETFSRLGISARSLTGEVRSVEDVLFDVGKRFKQLDLSLPEQNRFASELGIDKTLIGLITSSTSSIKKLRMEARELGIVTSAQAENVVKFRAAVATLKFGFNSLKNEIAIGLMPQFTNMAKSMTDFFLKNKGTITKFISGFSEVILSLTGSLGRLSPILSTATLAFLTFSAASVIAANALTFGLVAVIAGVLLAIDDLIVGINGGKSVLADFFGPGVLDAAQGFFDKLVSIKNVIVDIIGFIGKIAFGAIKFLTKIPEEDLTAFKERQQNLQPGGNTTSNSSQSNTINQTNEIKILTDNPQEAGNQVKNSLAVMLQDANNMTPARGI